MVSTLVSHGGLKHSPRQILLLVYVLYLLFQLKSHAYMYASTPQHVIDEESHPGVLADMLGSSSSSDASSSTNSSDTDGTSGSNTTAKRIKRALKGRRRRKSSASSKDTPSMPSTVRTPSAGTHTNVFEKPEVAEGVSLAEHRLGPPHELGVIASGDEADTDGEIGGRGPLSRGAKINYRDFENEKVGTSETRSPEVKPKKKAKKKHRKTTSHDEKTEQLPERITESHSEGKKPAIKTPSSPRVGLVQSVQIAPDSSPKRPFNIRALSRPALPNLLTPTVFSSVPPSGPPVIGPGAPTNMPRALNGVRRTTSLPDRLNQTVPTASAPPLPYVQPINASHVSIDSSSNNKATKNISRTTAVVLLLVSTGLVAICAEFLVGSINYLVDNTGVSEAFVGLIILPIVGNAAEHVTAVTVASKNKMDLAIGVAVGSSIQIGKRSPIHLFVLPLT